MLTREGGSFISISTQAPLKPPLPGRETPLQKSDTDRAEWGELWRRSLVQDMRSQYCRGKVIRMAPTYSSACPHQWSLRKHAGIINTRITGLLNACPPQQLDGWNKVDMKHPRAQLEFTCSMFRWLHRCLLAFLDLYYLSLALSLSLFLFTRIWSTWSNN